MCTSNEYASLSIRYFVDDKDATGKNVAQDTKYSYAVSHPSTNCAQSNFTAVIGREPAFSRRYGREHVCLKRICFSINSIICRRIEQWHGKKRAHDTKYSLAVSHPSTNSAQSSLTAVIGREPVFSRQNGREHVCFKRICFFFNSIC